MEVLKQYKARDGRMFDDRFECARWELSINPEVIALVEASMAGYGRDAQLNWCGGDPETNFGSFACGCVGCANRFFYDLELSYEHWKVWVDEFRVESSEPQDATEVDLQIITPGPDKFLVFQLIKAYTGVGSAGAVELVKTGTLKSAVSYDDAKQLSKVLEDAGAACKIVIHKR